LFEIIIILIVISVIIPVLNESKTIEHNIMNLLAVKNDDDEIIVVNGLSVDNTQDIVTGYPEVLFINSFINCRAIQMNRGVAEASGDYLLFLHSDTMIDGEAIRKIRIEAGHNARWGWFDMKMNSGKFIYRIIEKLAGFWTFVVSEPLGDRAIFVRKDVFEETGGYPELYLMEDVEFVKQLRKRGKGKRIKHFVYTSVRRFEKEGVINATLKICILRIMHALRTPDGILAKYYINIR